MAERVNKADFEQKVLRSELPVVVDFYSDSCIACKKLNPVLADAEEAYEGKLRIYKVNTNFDAELAEVYSVMANPTLIFFKGGKTAARITGALGKEELDQWITQNIE